jgi:hypothetical protein
VSYASPLKRLDSADVQLFACSGDGAYLEEVEN